MSQALLMMCGVKPLSEYMAFATEEFSPVPGAICALRSGQSLLEVERTGQ